MFFFNLRAGLPDKMNKKEEERLLIKNYCLSLQTQNIVLTIKKEQDVFRFS